MLLFSKWLQSHSRGFSVNWIRMIKYVVQEPIICKTSRRHHLHFNGMKLQWSWTHRIDQRKIEDEKTATDDRHAMLLLLWHLHQLENRCHSEPTYFVLFRKLPSRLFVHFWSDALEYARFRRRSCPEMEWLYSSYMAYIWFEIDLSTSCTVEWATVITMMIRMRK